MTHIQLGTIHVIHWVSQFTWGYSPFYDLPISRCITLHNGVSTCCWCPKSLNIAIPNVAVDGIEKSSANGSRLRHFLCIPHYSSIYLICIYNYTYIYIYIPIISSLFIINPWYNHIMIMYNRYIPMYDIPWYTQIYPIYHPFWMVKNTPLRYTSRRCR